MFCCHGSNTPRHERNSKGKVENHPNALIDKQQAQKTMNSEHVILSLQALTSHRQNRSSNVSFFVPYEESLNILVIDEISRKVYETECVYLYVCLVQTHKHHGKSASSLKEKKAQPPLLYFK